MVKMDADMDSPDRILSTPSSAVQGSPFFTYLSNLSPIKPIKSAHVAQTFSELHFPPPPAVFTSPRVSSQKELNFLRRASPKGIGEEEKKILNTSCEKVKDFAVPLSDCDVPTFVSPVAGQVTNHDSLAADQIKCDDKSMPTFPGCSPSKIVEQYLADPAEGGHYTVDSSKLYSKTPSPGLVEALFTGSDKLEDAITDQCEKMKDMEVISQSKSSEEFLCANERYAEAEISQGNEEGLSSDLEQSLKISTVRDIGNTDQNSNGEMPNVWSHVDADHTNALNFANDCEASGAGTSHDENLVDQTASAFAFLLSKGSTHSIEAWQKASSADPSNVSIQKDLKDLGKHSNQVGVHGNFDGTAQPAYNSLQDTNSVGNLNVKTDTDPNRPMEHTSYACKDANQPQRGMRRRCLDFEASEARRRNLVNETWKSTSMLPKTGSLVTTDDDSEKNTSSVSCERTATSDGKQLVLFTRDMGADTGRSSQSLSIGQLSSCSHKHSEPNSDKVDSSVRINGNSSISVGMPSGIGLHLNSLASTMPLNCGVGMLTTAKGSASMQGMQTSSVVKEASGDGRGCCLLPVSSSGNKSLASNTSMAPGMVVSVVEKTRIDQQEVQSSGNMQIGLTKSTTCFRSLTVGIKPLQCRQPFKTEEINPSPLEKKRPVLQDVSRQTGFGIGEEYNQNSPKKKRKSATIGDKEGCKRCNCKKSKCLKLYCECFAAGVYCVESCTCQECFNKPEYTDMVVGTRQQIESRNPLAFAPKIVHGADSPPTNGQKESTETPASARHKRGCNCKKSMCLKKYCECYQAGVGCSDGCRCEGCKNTFGKKEGGSDDTEDKEAQDEVWEKSTAEEKLELVNGNDILETEQRHSKDLSPLTPSFQYVGQDRSTVKLKPFGKRRFNTEDLESPIPSLSQSSAKPPRSPAKILRSTKGSDTVIFNHQVGSKTSASPIFTPKMEKSGQFSSRWDGLADICTLTPALQPPLRPATASVSNVDGTEVSPFGGQHNEISSLNSHPFASRHSCHGGSPSVFCHTAAQSPVCTSDSFHWQTRVNAQTTPMTRALYTSVCNAGKKLVDGPGIDMHSQDLCGSVEDDTPDILKNDCSPMRGIKASSPNQKRVSPPHNYSLKEMSKRGPISSPRLKNGRKFILQSVPSFPPLTTSEEVQDKD